MTILFFSFAETSGEKKPLDFDLTAWW